MNTLEEFTWEVYRIILGEYFDLLGSSLRYPSFTTSQAGAIH